MVGIDITLGSLVFDVGAFRGDKTQQYLKAGARVVCFEPNPDSARRLQKKYGRQATVMPVALGAKRGTVTLRICPRAPALCTCTKYWTTGRFRVFQWTKEIEVPCLTLDDQVVMYGEPDFVKIDVEGYEYEVLQGMTTPVPALSFEFACEFLDRTALCVAYLRRMGYRQFSYALGKSEEIKDWMDSERVMKCLHNLPQSEWGDIYVRYP